MDNPYDTLRAAINHHPRKPRLIVLSEDFDKRCRRHADFREHFSPKDRDINQRLLMGVPYQVDRAQTEEVRIKR